MANGLPDPEIGRPRWEPTDDDLAKIREMRSECLAAIPEVAEALGVSTSTLKRRMDDTPAVREAMDRGAAKGCRQLRSRLWEIAKGNRGDAGKVAMFLAMNELGMQSTPAVRVDARSQQAVTFVLPTNDRVPVEGAVAPVNGKVVECASPVGERNERNRVLSLPEKVNPPEEPEEDQEDG